VSRTKRGFYAFTRKAGHNWQRVWVPTTRKDNLAVDSIAMRAGVIAVGVHFIKYPDSPAVVVRTHGGKWTIVHGTRAQGTDLKVGINPHTKRVVAAYAVPVPCDTECGIRQRTRNVGGQATWDHGVQMTHGAGDQPLQLAFSPSGDELLTYYQPATA
jgi:hypothetical protein